MADERHYFKEHAVIRFPPNTIRYLAGAGLLLSAYIIASIVNAHNFVSPPAI